MMASEVPETSPRRILDITYSYFKSQVLFGACEVGIFAAIENLGQSASAIELAQKLDLSEDGAEHLLNACVSLQLLQKTSDKDGQEKFENTQESKEWLGSSPWNISSFVAYHQHLNFPSQLLRPGRRDKIETREVYQDLYSTRERMLQFQNGMDGYIQTSFWLLLQLPLDLYRTAVDLAGGLKGFIARSVKKLYPHMDVTLTELPPIITEARNTGLYEETGIRLAAVDFFKHPLPAADIYLLGHVIHNWNPDNVDVIIKAVYKALNAGGALVLLETVLDSCKTEPWLAVASELEMHCFTEGKERTEDEFRSLLQRHGFAQIKVYKDPRSPVFNAILARKME